MARRLTGARPHPGKLCAADLDPGVARAHANAQAVDARDRSTRPAEKLAALGSERLGCGRAALTDALRGRIREHHRFLLAQHLRTIEQLGESVAAFDARIAGALAPFRDVIERLNEVPGLGRIAIETIIAEIGTDMSPFPTARTSCHLGRTGSAPRFPR